MNNYLKIDQYDLYEPLFSIVVVLVLSALLLYFFFKELIKTKNKIIYTVFAGFQLGAVLLILSSSERAYNTYLALDAFDSKNYIEIKGKIESVTPSRESRGPLYIVDGYEVPSHFGVRGCMSGQIPQFDKVQLGSIIRVKLAEHIDKQCFLLVEFVQ